MGHAVPPCTTPYHTVPQGMSEDDIEVVLDKGIMLFRFLQARAGLPFPALGLAWWSCPAWPALVAALTSPPDCPNYLSTLP